MSTGGVATPVSRFPRRRPQATEAAGAPSSKLATGMRDRIALGIVLAATAASAVIVYALFLGDSRSLWNSVDHDRNFHYLAGLRLGIDLRSGHLVQFVSDFLSLRTWPPLHALLVGLLTAVGGPHYQLAVLPSLAAWCGTAVLAFLIVRRIAPAGGNIGGITAAMFILASPAFRAFAADVMLESLGACLSLLVIYFYIVDKQAETFFSKRFAVALSCLFFEKYNYWILVLIALTITESSLADPRRLSQLVRAVIAGPWRSWLSRQWKQPLNYVVVGLTALTLATHFFGGLRWEVFGLPIRFGRSSYNLWNYTFISLVLRVAACWPTEGRILWSQSSEAVRRLLLWHGLPLAVWFLLPKRLGYFVMYMSGDNGPNSDGSIVNGLEFYRQSLIAEYHALPWAAAVAAILIVVGIFSQRRIESRAVLIFLLVGLALTVPHPNRKSRFLHSWLPAAWIVAGAGMAALAGDRCLRRLGRLQSVPAAVAVAVLAAGQSQAFMAAGHAPDSDRRPQTSTLDVADVYRPWIADANHVAVYTTLPAEYFAEWSCLEAYPKRDRPEVVLTKWFGPSPEANQARFDAWLATTPAERVVLVDSPPGSRYYLGGYEPHRQIRELMEAQTVFVKAKEQRLADDPTVATLWERAAAQR